jgi:hypothetical protein
VVVLDSEGTDMGDGAALANLVACALASHHLVWFVTKMIDKTDLDTLGIVAQAVSTTAAKAGRRGAKLSVTVMACCSDLRPPSDPRGHALRKLGEESWWPQFGSHINLLGFHTLPSPSRAESDRLPALPDHGSPFGDALRGAVDAVLAAKVDHDTVARSGPEMVALVGSALEDGAVAGRVFRGIGAAQQLQRLRVETEEREAAAKLANRYRNTFETSELGGCEPALCLSLVSAANHAVTSMEDAAPTRPQVARFALDELAPRIDAFVAAARAMLERGMARAMERLSRNMDASMLLDAQIASLPSGTGQSVDVPEASRQHWNRSGEKYY